VLGPCALAESRLQQSLCGAGYLSCRVSSGTEGDRQLSKYRWWYLAAAAGSQGASVEARLNPLLSKLRWT